ncbi:MAG: B12-binding domain-containing radical SAM protein [Lachnospiraceae bacterium]|nr:B12-binding domain-containing radical SAM protein [Lachnospiraceae bacterium]
MSETPNNSILLIGINAKYIHSNPAVHSLKAYADKYYPDRPDGCALDIAEYTINQPPSAILADLYQRRPQAAAFSCYIWNWTMVQDLLAELPKLLPDTALWLGGPEVSFHAGKLMQELPQLAGIMVGEGEETFLELLQYYWEHMTELSDIRGIVCKDGFTGERGLADINKLPFIYNPTLSAFQNRILYYESQRGCPFQCAYCLSSIDRKVRLRDIETVKGELQYFLDRRVPQVKFIDRTFNCNEKHALSIWNYLREHDNGVTNFHFEIAADLLTERQLEVMRGMRPGLIQLEIGVQSTNHTTLQAINRRMDIIALRRAVAAIHSFQNIHQHLDLIAGLPYEDYDSFARSFNDVYVMNPNQLQLGFLKVLKGSPMEQRADEYGIVYGSKPPYEVLYTKWLSYDDVLHLKEIEEMVERYYNSNQFTHTLPVLIREFASPFHMYEALADYYRANGYLTSTPSRSYRYQILLDFACSVAPDKRALFAELLTFDLYLRENLKSRPDFLPENVMSTNAAEKKKMRQFFEHEEAAHEYLKGYDNYTSVQLLRMTHIEKFTYPVWKQCPEICTDRLETPAYLLFDYKNRSALTHDAAFYEILL